MKTIEETLAAVSQLQKEIKEKEQQVLMLVKEVVEDYVQNGNRYYCEEDNKHYFPCFSIARNKYNNNELESRGVCYPKDSTWFKSDTISVCCYPAKKDGTRALIGSKYIDITKLTLD